MRKIADQAQKSGRSLKKTMNDIISRGLGGTRSAAPVELPAWGMGRPLYPIDRSWEIVAEFEQDDVRHEMEKGS
ncbi:MAG TPA: hypothetical protein VMW87_01705 [Spirochaetia bacterium]|nr:hypothetical protein [Spirochaetia bacterium]